MYHLEQNIKNCAQVFLLNASKDPIRYAFRKTMESYTV